MQRGVEINGLDFRTTRLVPLFRAFLVGCSNRGRGLDACFRTKRVRTGMRHKACPVTFLCVEWLGLAKLRKDFVSGFNQYPEGEK
jgi:hypothetical protein